jgi:single-stranded DNA-binding protein
MYDNFAGFAGRLSQDVVYQKNVQEGQSRATGHLIVNREGAKGEYDTIPFVAWDTRADILYKHSRKGKIVLLRGAIRTNSVKDSSGKWTNYFELLVKHISLGADPGSYKPAVEAPSKQSSISTKAAEALLDKMKKR